MPAPDDAEALGPRTRGRWVAVAAILALLALLVVAGERASTIREASYPVDPYWPLEIGSTWVYESRSGDADPTTKVTQVIGIAVLADQPGQPTAAIVETRGYGGDTTHTVAYYVRRPGGLFMAISRDDGPQHDAEPNLPVLRVPLEEGASWEWSGTANGFQIPSSVTSVDGFEDMTVAGVEATGCVVTTTEFEIDFTGTMVPVTGRSWNCPGIGPVRSTTTAEMLDVDVTDELVAFSLPGRASADAAVAAADAQAVAAAAEAPGGGVGLDPGRSNSIDRAPDFDRVAWQDLRSTNPSGPPVGTDEVMVLAEEDGVVSSFDHRTGEVAWRVSLEGRALTSPVVAGGVVVVTDAGKSVWAIDLGTGRVLWQERFPDLASAPPLVSHGLAIVPGHDRTVRALRLADGSVAWEVSTTGIVVTPPALAGDLVIVADTSGSVLGLRVADGSEAWSERTALPSDGGPAVRDGLVVLVDQRAQVSGIDAATGDLRWQRSLPNFVSQPVAIGPDEVVVHVDSGRAFALDPSDGSTRWVEGVGRAENAPVVAGDEVLVLTEDSRLHRLDRATGEAIGVVEPAAPGDRQLSDTQVDMAAFGGLLVVEVDADEPRSNPYVAYPLERSRPAGVTVDVAIRALYPQVDASGPRAGPRPLGTDRVVFPDFSSAVWSVPFDPATPLERLLQGSTVPWAVPAGDTLLVQDGRLLEALPLEGGAPRWTFEMGEPYPQVIPAVADGRVYAPLEGGGVAALDLDSGDQLWREDHPGLGTASPVVVGDAVVTASGGLSAYDTATGDLRWRIDGVEGFSPPVADHGVVFASVATVDAGYLMAVEAASGRELWRVPFDGPIIVGPAASTSTVVGIESTGTVRAFDAGTGQERWRVRMRSYPTGHPVLLGDVVAVAEEGYRELIEEREYRVTFLDLQTGRYLGSYEPVGTAAQLPAFSLAGRRLMVYDVGFLLQLEVSR